MALCNSCKDLSAILGENAAIRQAFQLGVGEGNRGAQWGPRERSECRVSVPKPHSWEAVRIFLFNFLKILLSLPSHTSPTFSPCWRPVLLPIFRLCVGPKHLEVKPQILKHCH